MDKIVTDKKILSQVSKPTTWDEVKKLNLASRLYVANKTAWTSGAGLAAIQIGVPLRYALYIHNKKQQQLLNPVILQLWGEEVSKEGCLSIPNKWIEVSRAVTIEYLSGDKKKRAHGFEARLIQHEIDHMDGILITDKN